MQSPELHPDRDRRVVMVAALAADAAGGEVEIPNAVHPGRADRFICVQREAFLSGTPDTLAAALLSESILRTPEPGSRPANLIAVAAQIGLDQFRLYTARAIQEEVAPPTTSS